MFKLLLFITIIVNLKTQELKDGLFKEYYNNGKTKKTILIKDKKIVKETIFRKHYTNSTGEQLIKEEKIYTGDNSYILTSYNEIGNIKSRTEYKDNKKHGIDIKYDPLGDIKEKVHYVEGKKEGREYIYNINTQLKRTTNYLNGKKQGYETKRNFNNKVVEQNYYEDDQLVSSEKFN